MKTLFCILLSFLTVLKLQAQDFQVTLVDPCSTIEKKSTIIINDNAVMAANTLPTTVIQNNTFNFTLNISANTSAGVYNASGNLIRTLWNGVRYAVGSYKAIWSGVMDDGTIAPPGNYQVKVLTNNVQYTWEGVIGNSSTDFTGDYILKGNEMEDMCFVGAKGFMALGYSEHAPAQKMFLTGNIGKLANERAEATTQTSLHVCTDGNIVYWAGGNYFNKDSWVYGAYPADNASPYAAMVPFSAGVAESFADASGGATYNNAISVIKANYGAFISSICVQKSGNLLFIARAGLNQLQILNKTSGAILQTLTYANAASLACDNSGNLFMVYNNVLHKFAVTAAGVLTESGTSFTGLNSPGYMDVSPDYSTVAIADNDTRQVKFYSVNGGPPLNTLGTGVSYATSPYVDNYKFYSIGFVKYQPDGSLWVGDKENYRYLHFNADRTYKDQMAWVGQSRSASVDPNMPTRVFSGFVEYERDYSKTLDNGANGSWKLKANWKANIPDFDDYTRFTQVVTLTNNGVGHTYAIVRHTNNTYEIYELMPTGARATGIYPPGNPGRDISRDGTYISTENIGNDHMEAYKSSFNGFDGSGNPIWGSRGVMATSPSHVSSYTPAFFNEPTTGVTNASTKYIWFNNSVPIDSTRYGVNPDRILGWHLGAVPIGKNAYSWKASKSTFTNYYGAYPNNGDFDIGNGWPQQHSLTHAMVYDKDIFWNVNAEFWKGGQINVWNHFYDDGLQVGNFGVSGMKNNNGAAGMAGNAFGTAMAKVGNDYYIYHCDESVHAGIHSWHVNGLNTISEQSMPITVSATITTIASDPNSLMSGIPFKSNFTGGNGWTVDQPAAGLTMYGGQFHYQKDSTDLYISGQWTQVVKRTLNNNNSNLTTWKLSGGMTMQDSEPTISGNNYNYLEVLDNAGKIIARFQAYANTNAGYHTYLLVNSNITVVDGGIDDIYNNNTSYNNNAALRSSYNDFTFAYANGVLTFKLGAYNPVTVSNTFDTGANKSAPAYLRISQSSPGNQNHAMDLYKLKFTGN